MLNPKVTPRDAIAESQYVCNSTVHSTMKVSPYFVVYGRNPINRFDFGIVKDLPGSDFPYVEDIAREHKHRFETMQHANKLAARYAKYKHDTSYVVGPPNIKLGDLVMCRANTHERNLSRKFKIKQSGPYRVVALHKNCALLSDLEHNVLPDLKPFRALTKIDSYTETFPTDTVNCISFESQEGDDNCFVTAEEVPIEPSGFMAPVDCTDTKHSQSDSLVETVIKVSGKSRMRGGVKQVLVYPLGIKESGTWIPII